MRRLLLSIALCLGVAGHALAQTPIIQARFQPQGNSVTVSGTVINGGELGPIRYLQDATGGIPVYAPSVTNNWSQGDSITVTGTLGAFNQLTQIDVVTSHTTVSTGRTLPAPNLLTLTTWNDSTEATLISLNCMRFTTTGSFARNTTYNIIDVNGDTAQIYMPNNSVHPLIGTPIPTGFVNVTGPQGRFRSDRQILPRSAADIVAATSCGQAGQVLILTDAQFSNVTKTGATITWKADQSSDGYVEYGLTPQFELGQVAGQTGSDTQTVNLTGLQAGQVYFVRATSTITGDSASTRVLVIATESNSTGEVKLYFTTDVDSSASSGTIGVMLNNAVDDTLAAYMRRAEQSVDMAIYHWSGADMLDFIPILDSLHNAGVRVRIVCGDSIHEAPFIRNRAVTNLIATNPNIGVLKAPEDTGDYNIMHNKFVIIDAQHTDANKPWLFTGSMNFTGMDINTRPNNVVFVQDQALARAYELEFEEMFGDTGAQPNAANARFGPYKVHNTPNEFTIGGKRVELYMSPNGGTEAAITRVIESADDEVYFGVASFTRDPLANLLAAKANAGLTVRGVQGDTSLTGADDVYTALNAALGSSDFGVQDVFHSKSVAVDPNSPNSDPQVLLGSHNWTTSANFYNDENTLVFHDASLANQVQQHILASVNATTSRARAQAQHHRLALFPNPSTGPVNLQLDAPAAETLRLTLVDAAGRLVLDQPLPVQPGTQTLPLPTSTLPAGIYHVVVLGQGWNAVRTLALQR